MFCIFFISLISLARADLLSLWSDAGCSSEGVLSPNKVPHFWNTITDNEAFINQIREGTQAGDRLSITSCIGESEVSVGKTMATESYSKTFHLLWECADEAQCMLPPIHALCLRTLRTVHPQASIYLWSMTLNPTLMGAFLDEIDIELKHYDSTFFQGLPTAAVEASKDIQSFFSTEKDAYSHWSDLFRAAVLYKFGGVYTDLDSIWLRPIDQVSKSTAWIPSTPTKQEKLEEHDVITIGSQRLFLEGGILRFDEPNSPFLKRVLSEFPKYDKEMAECWACVGPRQLTTTFNEFLSENRETPELIDSQNVFGLKHYRNYFHDMHSEFDPQIWNQTLNKNVVAAHMFSGTPQGGISAGSTIFNFFQAGGVDDIVTQISASWREVKQRRGLMSSLYYLANTLTESQMTEFYGSAFMIGDQVIQLAPNAYLSEAIQGGGSVVFYAGEGESVTSVVSLGCDATDENIQEIRNIYYSGFNIPLASVHATISDADNTMVDVFVAEVDPHSVVEQAAAISLEVTQSDDLCDDVTATNVVTVMELPTNGYTQATFTVEKNVLTSSEHLAAQFEILDIIVESFGIDAEDLETQSTFKTHGRVNCAVSAGVDYTEQYEQELEQKFGYNCEYSESGDFWVYAPTFNEAINHRYYIANNAVSFSFSQFCFWVEDDITVVSENSLRKNGVTYTEMEDEMDAAHADFEGEGFIVTKSLIETIGTQAYGACQMFEECQSDYEQLYLESVGDLNIVEEADTEEISWWWRFQLDAQGVSEYLDNLKVSNGFFVYKTGDRYVNTCVQHHVSWITPCDNTIGVCAGGSNYGYSSLQASVLEEALSSTSRRHPDCPYGCESLLKNDLKSLYNSIVTATNKMSDSVSMQLLQDVCVMNSKYYVWSTPTQLLDTCIGYSANNDQTCDLSYYNFCSDITDSGYVVYGNSTMQGYSLTQALNTDERRHPACV